ncbi:hypothetical protein EII19_13195 [Comamonadaceae bacterium OH2310_COT-174]|nr:hypothetical protein EII19_13195 [Comamonadaceae bacterium OH2310_COT-174]
MDFLALAVECAPSVHQQTIAAIVQTESAGDPWAIGVNRASPARKKPKTKTEAVEEAKRLIKAGYNIDMGLGQINSANLDWLGLTVEQVFDPCTNLRAAAKILTMNFLRAGASHTDQQSRLKAALSAYNTGNFERGLTNGYVAKVYKAADRPPPTVPAITADAQATTPVKPKASPQPSSVGNAFGSSGNAGNVFSQPEAPSSPVLSDEELVRAAQLLRLLQSMQQAATPTIHEMASEDPAMVFPAAQ